MRVAIYSPIRLFGDALTACLRQETGVLHVHFALDIQHLLDAMNTPESRPDVVLFDTRSNDDVRAVKSLSDHHSEVPIVALCVPRVAAEVIACADAGFASYVPRDSPYADLVEIARMAIRGEMPCDPKISRSLLEEVRRRSNGGDERDLIAEALDSLTERETEILLLLGRGLANKEIAAELTLSVATVKNHVHSVLHKLGLQRRSEVAALVTRNSWLVRSA